MSPFSPVIPGVPGSTFVSGRPGPPFGPAGPEIQTYTLLTGIIWAATSDFQQSGILTSVDSDTPVQPPFKLRNSKWCSVNSLTSIEYSSD